MVSTGDANSTGHATILFEATYTNKHQKLVIVLSIRDHQDMIYKRKYVHFLPSQKMDTATRVQILAETNCISHSTNTLGKGMNPIILPPAMGK